MRRPFHPPTIGHRAPFSRLSAPSEAPEASKSTYHAFMQRQGPAKPGSKPLPRGAENCLAGLKFCITGEMESSSRGDIKDVIQRHGGTVTGNVSGRTSYAVVGTDAGPSKLEKIKEHKTKVLSEDALFELVLSSEAKPFEDFSVSLVAVCVGVTNAPGREEWCWESASTRFRVCGCVSECSTQ